MDLALGVILFLLLRSILRHRRKSDVDQELLPATPQGIPLSSPLPIRPLELPEELPSVSLPSPLASVSAEEADRLADDTQASLWIIPSRTSSTVCRGCRKTPINLDTVSQSFFPGDVVSLDTLKEKGLIPKNACFLKILARGSLDKPLTVRAQSFSAAAVKMIVLTGGEAILEGALPKSRKKK